MITAGLTTTNNAVNAQFFVHLIFLKESFPPHVLNKTTMLRRYLLYFYYTVYGGFLHFLALKCKKNPQAALSMHVSL